MIDAGGALGFAIAFIVLVVALSAIACTAIAVLGPTLARRGPAVERRAIELAVLAPVLLAAAAIAVLVAHSLVASDHCPAHDHHAHLCFAHGEAWLERPWAAALAAAAVVTAGARAAALGWRLLRGRARVRALARMAHAIDDVRLIDSPRAFCFVAGLRRPAIYASRVAWEGLADDERRAMLAHERAHVRGGDVARRALVELATALAAPLAPGWLAARWDDANERLRDRDAARATEPEAVARALVAMCRLCPVRVAGASFDARAGALARRLDAVLADVPAGDGMAARLARIAAVAAALAVAAAVLLADPLHHAIETLLG